MKYSIRNLSNVPFDVSSLSGPVYVPANGEAQADLDAYSAEAMKISPYVEVEEVSEAPAEVVEIPADWQALKWQQKRSLASKLTDEPIKKGETADRVIAAEVAKREG